MNLTGTVYVELPSTRLEAGEVVLAAALNLLPAELRIELGLAGVTHEPSRQQTDYVTEMCRRVAPDHPHTVAVVPDRRLGRSADNHENTYVARVVASPEPTESMNAVLVISAMAQAFAMARVGTTTRPVATTTNAW